MKKNSAKFKSKKWISAAVLGTLLVSGTLAGCSSNSASSDKTTITVWGMGEEAKSLPKIADEFEKENPKIDVKVQAIPWDTAHDKLLTAVASKKGPDVLQMGTTWIPEFASANALMDLTPHIKDYPELDPAKYYEGSVETTKFEDKTVGVPWYIDTRVLYYRTDLLKEAGYNEAPKTWNELQDAAKKLSERGKGKYGISLDIKEQSLAFMFARQNGSTLLDEQNKPLFNEPEFTEAVEYLNGFFKNGSAPKDELGIDIIQGFRDDGILPMFISGPWMIKLINDQAPELEGKWATAVLPAKENNISALGGSNLSIFEHTKNKDASLKFLAYMSKPETQLKWMEMTNSLPSTKAAWEDESLKENPLYKTFGEQMKHSQSMPVMKEWEKIAQTYLSTFEKIYRGGADVEKELDQFNKKSEEILNK
ncbi:MULTISPECIES: sugar ABC transporter substrate-binding protein [Metabacillus]|uniref:Sugar ABC transporter substrate-binding protein n=1 Tax=Metabacillus hrfriensis TaxID=3048891 RepID=A0ACD4RE58_9BACI|nr:MULTISPECIES: sugar ABC transporter substrate-binding protein [Metabacillus]UAL53240.1 sugar ABC transporter substrate-binding protein [Metabacillus dongyingensis]USK29557.1 sugar ABC transporter substrate-binding protein [Bacillus sp. CMF21]WHZ58798.1 sugar ABC transporter substrate-binding protein [Metabacillus sp. CT-WN-B3]